ISTLALVLARWSGLELILIAVMSHGRDILDDIDVSRTMGGMNTANRELLHIDTSASLIDTLNSVKEQRRRIPNRGKHEKWISDMHWHGISDKWYLSKPHALFNHEGVLRTR